MEKKVGAELENGTICLHLSHNYWDCSNFRDAKIPLKANKSSLKSELIFPRGLHASPWKTLRDAHLKVGEGDALNIQFPNISSSCLDNYAGLLAQVFVLGILNAGWHLLWTVMLLEIFDLPVCGGSVWFSVFSAVQQHPLLIIYDMITSPWGQPTEGERVVADENRRRLPKCWDEP